MPPSARQPPLPHPMASPRTLKRRRQRAAAHARHLSAPTCSGNALITPDWIARVAFDEFVRVVTLMGCLVSDWPERSRLEGTRIGTTLLVKRPTQYASQWSPADVAERASDQRPTLVIPLSDDTREPR